MTLISNFTSLYLSSNHLVIYTITVSQRVEMYPPLLGRLSSLNLLLGVMTGLEVQLHPSTVGGGPVRMPHSEQN